MSGQSLLARLGLSRPEVRAWALYDWANSPFQSTVINAVFPLFFASYAAKGLEAVDATARFAWATTIAVTIVAIAGPVLGAIADFKAWKKRLLAIFMVVGVIAVLMMAAIQEGAWMMALAIFILANIGDRMSWILYDSLLPHIATRDEMDRVSTAAYAIGYIGGGILLLGNLAWILTPKTFGLPDTGGSDEAVLHQRRPLVAALFLSVISPSAGTAAHHRGRRSAHGERVPRGIRTGRRDVSRAAYVPQRAADADRLLLYNDGIQTMIRMAAVYGAEVGIDSNAQIAAFVLVQFVGVPFSFLFGMLADRIGAKPAVLISVVVYTIVSIIGYFLATVWQFFLLAFLVGTVQGGSQALSRSLFARMIPRHKSSEYFGFFSIFEKFSGIAGPLVFAASVTLFGNSRAAVLSIILFFILGALVLTRVNVREGEAQAAAASLS
jgi:UMF1 family MFS transporter